MINLDPGKIVFVIVLTFVLAISLDLSEIRKKYKSKGGDKDHEQ